MYANRYAQPTRFSPGGLAAAVAINAAVIAALVFSAPSIVTVIRDHPLTTYPVEPETPPPPVPQPKPLELKPNRPVERIDVPKAAVPTPNPIDLGATTLDPPAPFAPAVGADPGPAAIDPPAPLPLPYVEASVDPRYAGDLQPGYPPSERRAAREGRVTVKVLIGVDGRVKQAERLAATSDAFWRVTLDQAMRRWRFRPATRGGVPVEAWRTMSLRFELNDE